MHGHNRPRPDEIAILGATQFPNESPNEAERPTAIAALRKLMAEAAALSETARKANDLVNYRIWSKRVADIAQALLPHESPRLSAVMTTPVNSENRLTKFVLNIFEPKSRKPLHVPPPAPSAAVLFSRADCRKCAARPC